MALGMKRKAAVAPRTREALTCDIGSKSPLVHVAAMATPESTCVTVINRIKFFVFMSFNFSAS